MKRDNQIIKEILVTIRDIIFKKGDPFEIPNIEYSILEDYLKFLINENLIYFESKEELTTGQTIFFGISLRNKGYDFLETLEK